MPKRTNLGQYNYSYNPVRALFLSIYIVKYAKLTLRGRRFTRRGESIG